MRKTKIVCTIGPSTDSEEKIEELVRAGMNAARLNFSHGDYEEHRKRIECIKAVRGRMQAPVAIILDTKGPEVRLGKFRDGCADLVNGQEFTLTTEEIIGDSSRCSITYKALPDEVKEGSRVLIADGLIELKVKRIENNEVVCEVVNGCRVSDRKNVNIPGATSKLPALTEKDVSDLMFGIENGVDYIAASFIRKGEDVRKIREILIGNGGAGIGIIAKIENQEGVDNIDEILEYADGIMVARGDLGVELPTEIMPIIQKRLIKKANEAGKPVITATQMLESMISNPRPTRAEVTDIANSIMDGTDAIMLSGETANGRYPVEAVEIMATVAQKTEEHIRFSRSHPEIKQANRVSVTDSICHAATMASQDLGAAAIIAPTNTGYTAMQLSKFRPDAPIIAAVHDESIARKLSLGFGVHSIKIPVIYNTDELIEIASFAAKTQGYAKKGDTVVICAGIPSGTATFTNMMKVHVIA